MMRCPLLLALLGSEALSPALAACGGRLDSPGTVRFGSYDYEGEDCVWTMEAGVGKVVAATITAFSMDLSACDDSAGTPLRSQDALERYTCADVPMACGQEVVRNLCPSTCNSCRTCNYNFLSLREGGDGTGTELLRVCGGEDSEVVGTEYLSAGQTLSAVLHMGYLFQKGTSAPNTLRRDVPYADGFELTWVEWLATVDPPPEACTGHVTLPETRAGTFSDGTHGHYSHDTTCTWTVTVPAGSFVKLSFTKFTLQEPMSWASETETGFTSCVHDHLTVTDGDADAGVLLFACGRALPEPIVSTSNEITVTFETDAAVTSEGFVAVWEAVDAPGPAPIHCSNNSFAVLSELTGSITEWHHYAGNTLCTWVLQAPVGWKVMVKFSLFHLEPSFPECVYDRITLFDGAEETALVLSTLCDSLTPPPLVSTGNAMRMQFRSDPFVAGKGFSLTWEFIQDEPFAPVSVCEHGVTHRIDERSPSTNSGDNLYWGMVSDGSGFGKGSYELGVNCSWSISAPEGYHVRLVYQYFDLLEGRNCDNAQVTVSEPGVGLLQRVCGSGLPAPVTSTGRSVEVNFLTSVRAGADGFMIRYEFSDVPWIGTDARCEGTKEIMVQAGVEGQLSDGAAGHARAAHCVWILTAAAGEYIEISFDHMGQGEHPGFGPCGSEYVDVRDGPTDDAYPLVIECGDEVPPPLTSTGNVVRLTFHSDASVTENGFQASYKAVRTRGDESLRTCWNRTVLEAESEDTGVISSNHIASQYRDNARCEWVIRPPVGKFVHLRFTRFNLEVASIMTFCYDSLGIHDGLVEEDDLIVEACGTDSPNVLGSTVGPLFLHFSSDDAFQKSGFEAEWFILPYPSVCNGPVVLRDTSIPLISSTDIYHETKRTRQCTWLLLAPIEHDLTLNITTTQSICYSEFLEVRYGGPKGPLLPLECQQTIVRANSSLHVAYRGTGFSTPVFTASWSYQSADIEAANDTDTQGQKANGKTSQLQQFPIVAIIIPLVLLLLVGCLCFYCFCLRKRLGIHQASLFVDDGAGPANEEGDQAVSVEMRETAEGQKVVTSETAEGQQVGERDTAATGETGETGDSSSDSE